MENLVNIVIYLSLLLAMFALIFLQNSRSIYLRVIGLVIIFLAAVADYILKGFTSSAPVILTLMSLLAVFGILSDLYSATLRTWFFSVSNRSMIAATYGIMFGILVLPIIGLDISHSLMIGTIVGSLIGELRAYGSKSPVRIIKSILGTVVGLFGMATKILIGLEMINIFFYI